MNTTVTDDNVITSTLSEPFDAFGKLIIESGVEHLNSHEHFPMLRILHLMDVKKLIEKYYKLMADNLAGINIEPIDYKL